MDVYSLKSNDSHLTIETQAVGMLARFAHDLSIEAGEIDLVQVREQDEGLLVELRVPVAKLSVAGVVKGGRVVTDVLSAADRGEIQRKIATEVLHAAEVRVTAEINASGPDIAAGTVKHAQALIEVSVGREKTQTKCELTFSVEGPVVRTAGVVSVDLPSLGISPPKGPLGAFKVKDEVAIRFDICVIASDSIRSGNGSAPGTDH